MLTESSCFYFFSLFKGKKIVFKVIQNYTEKMYSPKTVLDVESLCIIFFLFLNSLSISCTFPVLTWVIVLYTVHKTLQSEFKEWIYYFTTFFINKSPFSFGKNHSFCKKKLVLSCAYQLSSIGIELRISFTFFLECANFFALSTLVNFVNVVNLFLYFKLVLGRHFYSKVRYAFPVLFKTELVRRCQI